MTKADVEARLPLLEILESDVGEEHGRTEAERRIEEVRILHREEEAVGAPSDIGREIHADTTSEEVRLRKRCGQDEAVLRRESGAEAERAGRPLGHGHVEVEQRGVFGRTRLERDVLEEAEVPRANSRDLNGPSGVELPLDDAHLAADHRVDGARVARDVDVANEVERPLLDVELDIDALRLFVDARPRLDLGEVKPAIRVVALESFDVGSEVRAVECFGFFEAKLAAQRIEVDRFVADDIDLADRETRSFDDRHGDVQPVAVGFHLGLADLDLQVAGVGVLLLDLAQVAHEDRLGVTCRSCRTSSSRASRTSTS